MNNIKSSFLDYYIHKIIFFIFGVIFLFFGLPTLHSPNTLFIRTFSPKYKSADFWNSFPFLILGLIFMFFFFFLVLRYFRIIMNNNGLTIIKIFKRVYVSWDEIEEIKILSTPLNGRVFKVKLNPSGKIFYFLSDYSSSLEKDINELKNSKMKEYLIQKKILD